MSSLVIGDVKANCHQAFKVSHRAPSQISTVHAFKEDASHLPANYNAHWRYSPCSPLAGSARHHAFGSWVTARLNFLPLQPLEQHPAVPRPETRLITPPVLVFFLVFALHQNSVLIFQVVFAAGWTVQLCSLRVVPEC